jgi:hypothetical protein
MPDNKSRCRRAKAGLCRPSRVAVDGVADALQQFEVEFLWDRVAAMMSPSGLARCSKWTSSALRR